MGISGTWQAQQAVGYAGASRWGTGVNRIHAIRDGEGRNVAPDALTAQVPDEFLSLNDDDYGYCDEDYSSSLWGYGSETGTDERPRLGDEETVGIRADTDGWPPPGSYRNGIPGGSYIRSIDKGAELVYTVKATQPDAQSGHVAKELIFGEIEDAVPSDPSQYEMQTSMTQMQKDREGSQRSGSQSDYAARVPGRRHTMAQRGYVPSGGQRHTDMLPKQQDLLLRPFAYRTAGTGNPEWMQANELGQRIPLQRIPSPDPYIGVEIPSADLPGFIDEGWGI